jgi:hypothetical protein
MRCASSASDAIRIVEIQKADAVRFYGPNAFWQEVAQRLLDQTCTNRTGRHEEDGCWPDFGRLNSSNHPEADVPKLHR